MGGWVGGGGGWVESGFVLPAPEGPTMEVTVPGWRRRETPLLFEWVGGWVGGL